MEHIDWIVSFVIFIFVILAIITAIPRFLPDNLKQEDLYTSKIVYSQLTENIEKYTVYSDNNYQDIFFLENIDKGRATSNFIIDENILFLDSIKKSTFYYYDANSSFEKPKTIIFKEKIIDENSLVNFQLDQGQIISFNGEAYAYQETTLKSIENYSNVYFEYVVEPQDMNVYFNYADVNNYSLCSIDQNQLKLYDQNSSGSYLVDFVDVNFSEEQYFITLKVNTNYNGEVSCVIEDYIVENNTQSSINSGQIILKNINEQFIDSFEIYKNNYLEINSNIVNTNYFDLDITGNQIDLNIFENRNLLGNLILSFENNLDYSLIENNNPGIIKDSLSKQKLVIFPNTNQLIAIIENEDVNFEISQGLEINNYDYEIEYLTDYYTWIKMDILENSQKTIYLKKVNGYQPENDFLKVYDSLTHPSTTITNQGSGLFKIDIDNTGGLELLNYEIRLDNNILSLASTTESLLITDSNFTNINKIILENKIENKYVIIEFLDNDRNLKECTVNIIDNGFNINCTNKTYLKIKITDTTEQEKSKYLKSLEKIITKEKIDDVNLDVIDNYNYFIKLYNNKQNIEIGNYGYSGDFKILEKISKYLNEKGQEEIVKVLIKPN
jgi:hypothetical protein